MKLTRRGVLIGAVSATALTVAGVQLRPGGTATPPGEPDLPSPAPPLTELDRFVREHGVWVAGADAGAGPDTRQATRLAASYPRPAVSVQVTAVIGCSGRYELRVDGVAVAHGPGAYHHEEAVLDVLDLSGIVTGTGEVALEVDVVEPGLETGTTERPRRGADAVAGGQALVLVVAGDAIWSLADQNWHVAPSPSWDLGTPAVNHALGWVEHRLADGSDAVHTPDPSDVPPAAVAEPFPRARLIPRPEALLPSAAGSTAVLRRPTRIVRAGRATPAMPSVDAVMENLQTADIETIAAPEADAPVWEFETDGDDLHVLVDFGQVWTGAFHLAVDTDNRGAVVDVGLAEEVSDARLVVDDVASNHAHRFATSRIWRLRPSGVRYMHIVVRDPGRTARLADVGLVCSPAPSREGSFACSDDGLTALWEAGARTIEGAWADLLVADPAREMRAWVGDMHVGLRTARTITWEAADVEATRFLERVALLRRVDGSLPKYAPGEAPEYSTIPGYVLAWVLALAEHAAVSPGGAALAEQLGSVTADALDWFDQWTGDDGLVRDVEGWLFADWTPARLDGTSLYFSALRRQVDLALARTPRLAPDTAAAAFAQGHRAAWRDVTGAAATSQQANAQAVLAGLLTGDAGRRAMDDALTNAFLLDRTVAPNAVAEHLDISRQAVAAQPYQATFVLDALAALDMRDQAVNLLRERWVPLVATSPTLGEFFDDSGSRCHPWSTAPTAWLTRHALGLQLTGPRSARIDALDTALTAADGSLPTPHGPLELAWERAADGNRGGTLTVPDGLSVEVVAADGTRRLIDEPGATTVTF